MENLEIAKEYERATMAELNVFFKADKINTPKIKFESLKSLNEAKELALQEIQELRALFCADNAMGIWVTIRDSDSTGKVTYIVNLVVDSEYGTVYDTNTIPIEYTCYELSSEAFCKAIYYFYNRFNLLDGNSENGNKEDALRIVEKFKNSIWLDVKPEYKIKATVAMLREAGYNVLADPVKLV